MQWAGTGGRTPERNDAIVGHTVQTTTDSGSQPKAWDTFECGLVAVKTSLDRLGWVGLRTRWIGPSHLNPRTSAVRVRDGNGRIVV